MLSARPRLLTYPTKTPPQFVGGYFQAVAGTTSSTVISLTSLTGGLASAPAEDDIVVVIYGVATGSSDVDLSVDGYTELIDMQSGGAYRANLSASWKKMTASPDTSITINGTDSTNNGTAVAIHVWRGYNLSTPWETATQSASGTSSQIPDPPAIYTASNGTIVLCVGAVAANGTIGTPSAGYLSNVFAGYSNNAYDFAMGIGSVVSPGGAYNGAPWSVSGSPAGENWAALTMALKPA